MQKTSITISAGERGVEAGGYCGRMLWEDTVGGYCGRSVLWYWQGDWESERSGLCEEVRVYCCTRMEAKDAV